MSLLFHTDFQYSSRETKQQYVWQKYSAILSGATILDVGGDQGFLMSHLPPTSRYNSIGYGEKIDQHYNLENTPYPFADKSFDVVLCLDVLEHLEKIHAAFDECCRLAARHVIISLPIPTRILCVFYMWENIWGDARI